MDKEIEERFIKLEKKFETNESLTKIIDNEKTIIDNTEHIESIEEDIKGLGNRIAKHEVLEHDNQNDIEFLKAVLDDINIAVMHLYDNLAHSFITYKDTIERLNKYHLQMKGAGGKPLKSICSFCRLEFINGQGKICYTIKDGFMHSECFQKKYNISKEEPITEIRFHGKYRIQIGNKIYEFDKALNKWQEEV